MSSEGKTAPHHYSWQALKLPSTIPINEQHTFPGSNTEWAWRALLYLKGSSVRQCTLRGATLDVKFQLVWMSASHADLKSSASLRCISKETCGCLLMTNMEKLTKEDIFVSWRASSKALTVGVRCWAALSGAYRASQHARAMAVTF